MTLRSSWRLKRRPSGDRELASIPISVTASWHATRRVLWSAPEASGLGTVADRQTDRAAVPLLTGTITFLFTDVEGSTLLWEQDAEAMRPALARHDSIVE